MLLNFSRCVIARGETGSFLWLSIRIRRELLERQANDFRTVPFVFWLLLCVAIITACISRIVALASVLLLPLSRGSSKARIVRTCCARAEHCL